MAVFTGNGSAVSPSITFSSSTGTGIYLYGANTLGLATGGQPRAYITSSGDLFFGQDSTNGGRATVRTVANWNFPQAVLRRASSNAANIKQLTFALDGDNPDATNFSDTANIGLALDSAPTTGSTSVGLNAGLVLAGPKTVRFLTNATELGRFDNDSLNLGATRPAGVRILDRWSANWNFPAGVFERASSNASNFKVLALTLDGDDPDSTSLYDNVNIAVSTDSPPTTGSTSVGLNAGLTLTTAGTGAVQLSPGGAVRMRVTAAGNVGINKTAPLRQLHVAGATESNIIMENLGQAANERLWRMLIPGGGKDFTINATSDDLLSSEPAWIVGRGVGATVTSHSWYTANAQRLVVDAIGTVRIGPGAGTTDASRALEITNALVVPSTNPTSGGVIYVEAGALKYRGSAGTVTTIAPA